MQDKLFLMAKNHYVRKIPAEELFIFSVRSMDINKLKKCPDFVALKESIVSKISLTKVYEQIAVPMLQENKLAVLKFLIDDCGFIGLVNTKDQDGITLFLEACTYGYQEIIRFLLDKGADVNLIDNDGNSGLHRISMRNSCADLIPILKSRGANIDFRDGQGASAYHIAVIHNASSCASALKRCGANSNLRFQKYDALSLRRAISKGEIVPDPLPELKLNHNQGVENGFITSPFYYGLFQPKRNQQIFQNFVSRVLDGPGSLSENMTSLVIVAYLIGF
jgi:ankyrin repeat protein